MRGEDVVSKCGIAEIQIKYIELPDFHMVWRVFLCFWIFLSIAA